MPTQPLWKAARVLQVLCLFLRLLLRFHIKHITLGFFYIYKYRFLITFTLLLYLRLDELHDFNA